MRKVFGGLETCPAGYVGEASHFLSDASRQFFHVWSALATLGGTGKLNFVVHAVHEGGGLDNPAGFFVHEVVYLGRYAPGLQLQNGIGRDDVPSLARMQRSDVNSRSTLAVAGNGMQVQSAGSRR